MSYGPLSHSRHNAGDRSTKVGHGIKYFSPKHLLSGLSDCASTDIDSLCAFYKLDSTVVARELSTFRPLFKQVHTLVSVDDLLPSHSEGHVTAMTHDQEDELEPDSTGDSLNNWASIYQPFACHHGVVWVSNTDTVVQDSRDIGYHKQ